MNLNPGDILLVEGRRWRLRMTRRLLGRKWNHIVLVKEPGRVIELTWKGGPREEPVEKYRGRRVVILRPYDLDYLGRASLMAALDDYPKTVKFDWLGVFFQMARLPRIRIPNYIRCDEFAEEIYKNAMLYIDFWNLMGQEWFGAIGTRWPGLKLEKVFDYRHGQRFLE